MKPLSICKRTAFIALGLVLATVFQVQAHEPRVVEYEIVDHFATSGPLDPGTFIIGDDYFLTMFRATEELDKSWILLVFPGMSEDPPTAGKPVGNLESIIWGKEDVPEYIEQKNPEPIWRAYAHAKHFLIPPGGEVPVWAIVDFLQQVNRNVAVRLEGKAFIVSEENVNFMKGLPPEYVSLFVEEKAPAQRFTIDAYYKLSEKTWSIGSYKEIFGAPYSDPLRGRHTGDYEQNLDELPVLMQAYRSNLPLPGDFKDDGGRLLEETLQNVKESGSGMAGDQICFEEEIGPWDKQVAIDLMANSHVLSGIFSTKWASDHSLHPGFGWKVEAWTNETGSWQKLAEGWVQSNGTWSLGVSTTKNFQGNQLRMIYRPSNSYFQPQDRNSNTYAWADPDRTNISAGFNAGHRYADTDGGSYNGIGDLYDHGYRMWSRLYWIAGVNPVPSSPIRMYFPNTWDNCGGASPWSCANTSGEIWLIAAHGIRGQVVTHELAHQLNNKYWNNKRPANSGGSHNMSSCYSTRLGMTLREGFANFMPAWVGYQSRNVADGGFNSDPWDLDYDAETRNAPPNCANGWQNEIWVTRVFWDLHDTHSDGDDILWFNHPGAVIALFLANGIANDGDARDMRDYESIYRSAASSGHEGFITDIFEQNRH